MKLNLVFAATQAVMIMATNTAVASPDEDVKAITARLSSEIADSQPHEWGENVTNVKSRMATTEKVIALTLDACGSVGGKGVDMKLVDFLIREKIPATLFINARWIDANMELFKKLASNPLFEIANHGMWHKPASVNGRSVYGISGTKNLAELVMEIELNARKIEEITGKRPVYYRSGTAYYDDLAVKVSNKLGHEVIGFSLLGDAGATWPAQKVRSAVLSAKPGDIIIAHMNRPESGTGEGLIAAIPELKKMGFSFVHLNKYRLK